MWCSSWPQRGCVLFLYIHPLVCTHIFLHIARAQSHFHIFMRVHIHAWLKVMKKGVCCMWVISLHLAFSRLMSHPSLLFLDGHFEDHFLTLTSTRSLPYLPVLKAQGMRISARAARIVAIWPSPLSTQVMSPKSSTRSLLWTMTRCSLTIQVSMKSSDFSENTHENTGLFSVSHHV